MCDTAGLRAEAEADVIEVEGMRRARALLAEAAMLLVVVDVSDGRVPTAAEIGAMLAREATADSDGGAAADAPSAEGRVTDPRAALVVLNKVDALGAADGASDARAALHVDGLPRSNQFVLSCATEEGLEQLVAALESRVRELLDGGGGGGGASEGTLITRARHREHLEQALGALERFEQHGPMLDLAAEELRIAASEVGKVTGRIQVEEMLDIIFRDFCIGK